MIHSSLTAACVATFAAASLVAAGDARAQPQRAVFGPVAVETFASGLDHPWSLAFLPGGGMLVTERPGRLRFIGADGTVSAPIAGLPPIAAGGQGGLLDIALDRGFVQNRTLYFCFSDPAEGGSRTSMARAQISADLTTLEGLKVIFRQQGPLSSGNHFGCRIVQMPDNTLMLTTGDHFSHREEAQNLANHLGKVIRVNPDGSVPPDNPFVGRTNAKPEIWSYGHRNMQGAAIDPRTNRYWTHEHGARGGDEINIPEAGKNYGWPVITWGIDYNGAKIGIGTRKEGMEQPIHYWVPSIAPSGMAFYTGELFPQWRNNLFVGALAGQMLVRLELDGDRVAKEDRLLHQLGERIRDVRAGPDGAIWLLTDNSRGRVLRVVPAK